MDLRTKLLLGIGITLTIAFALVAIFSAISMESSYQHLENYEVGHAVGSTLKAMEIDMRTAYSTARDYSAWTETYRFAQGENPGWVGQNMGTDFFSRFSMDYVFIYDKSGHLIYTVQYNATANELSPVPDALIADITDIVRVTNFTGAENGTVAITDTTNGPVFMASHPILTDDFEGPATGSLHLVRRLDNRYLAGLSEREGYTITIVPSEDLQDSTPFAGAVSRFSSGRPGEIRADNNGNISGYVPLDDTNTPNRYYLRVSEPRNIYNTGMAGIVTFLSSLAVAGVFIILCILLFVDRIILSRLNSIIRTVRARKSAGDSTVPSAQNGEDEISQLAMAIDPVFAQLAESRERLSESEERYRTLAESARDFIFIIDRDDRIVYVNTFAADSVGHSRAELVGTPRSTLFSGDTGEHQRESIRRVLSTGLPLKIESSLPLPTGENWQDTLLVPIRDRNNTITGVMGISRDITKRKRAEEAVQASNVRFRTVMDSLDALVYVADMQSCEVLFLNQRGRHVWGDIIGKECWKTIQDGQTGPCSFCTNNKLVDDTGNPTDVLVWEYQNRVTSRWYECRDRAIRWTDGRLVRLEIATDITDRKKAEDALFNVNKKLNLLSTITRHDILNQLTALATYLDLSLDYADNDTLKDFITKEQQIAAIINREINFTRDYQELGVQTPVWHNVNATITGITRSLIAGKVNVNTGFSDLEIFADPLLEKVFFNLLDNAIRYGGEHLSEIRFSARETGDGLVISCEDDGPGVPPEIKTQIFQQGFGHNTGLGLFLSQEILGITGITIAETGTFGFGARFEITVPKGMYRFTGRNHTG
ncbi:CHASE4 domain-containing protein [Methanoregula sp.]|uniref:CHASE4 domain-containing protein n=1 Tax=Methanoregula sp. TaxID=2052170 RepID=UPI00236BCB34|nr:CHASE4 domain-containing protein [Methanoregula sp.]MDD1687715.1 PAS domain S-box protein [Methanoregula sp.]